MKFVPRPFVPASPSHPRCLCGESLFPALSFHSLSVKSFACHSYAKTPGVHPPRRFPKWNGILPLVPGHHPADPPVQPARFLVFAHCPRFVAQPDRKSTRLNSSHMSISYSVFCLKKKTTRTNIL